MKLVGLLARLTLGILLIVLGVSIPVCANILAVGAVVLLGLPISAYGILCLSIILCSAYVLAKSVEELNARRRKMWGGRKWWK